MRKAVDYKRDNRRDRELLRRGSCSPPRWPRLPCQQTHGRLERGSLLDADCGSGSWNHRHSCQLADGRLATDAELDRHDLVIPGYDCISCHLGFERIREARRRVKLLRFTGICPASRGCDTLEMQFRLTGFVSIADEGSIAMNTVGCHIPETRSRRNGDRLVPPILMRTQNSQIYINDATAMAYGK